RIHGRLPRRRKRRRGQSAGRRLGDGLRRPTAWRLHRPGSACGSALSWTGGIAGKRARPGRDLGPRAAARIAVGLRSSGGHRTSWSGDGGGRRSPVGATRRKGSNVSARRAVRATACPRSPAVAVWLVIREKRTVVSTKLSRLEQRQRRPLQR